MKIMINAQLPFINIIPPSHGLKTDEYSDIKELISYKFSENKKLKTKILNSKIARPTSSLKIHKRAIMKRRRS